MSLESSKMATSSSPLSPLDNKPTIRDLMLHANVRTNWRQMGIQLNLEHSCLDVIDVQYHSVADKVSAMYSEWLKTDLKPTTRTVIQALVELKEIKLAKKYEETLNIPSTCSIGKLIQ